MSDSVFQAVWEWAVSHGAVGIMALVFGGLYWRCILRQDKREERLTQIVSDNAVAMALLSERISK